MTIDKKYAAELEKARTEYEDLLKRGNEAIGPEGEYEELERQFFTEKEIQTSRQNAKLLGEMIKARQEKGVCQNKTEELSATELSQISAINKLLAPLGKRLGVVSI